MNFPTMPTRDARKPSGGVVGEREFHGHANLLLKISVYGCYLVTAQSCEGFSCVLGSRFTHQNSGFKNSQMLLPKTVLT